MFFFISLSSIIILSYVGSFFNLNILTHVEYSGGDNKSNEVSYTCNLIGDSNSESSDNKDKDLVNIKNESDKDKDYYSIKVRKDIVDNGVNFISETVKVGLEKVIPNAGAGTAAGIATAAMIKASANMPPLQRAMAMAGTTLVTGTTAKVALSMGDKIVKNIDVTGSIKNSVHADPNVDKIPSPSDSHFQINSPLENSDMIFHDTPLESLLLSLFTVNLLISFLTISLLYLIFYRYILNSNLGLILSLVEKYMPNKFND